MFTPPRPIFPARTLERLRSKHLTLRPGGRLVDDAGAVVALFLASGSTGDGCPAGVVAWEVGELPPGAAPVLLNDATLAMLREAKPRTDGRLDYRGQAFELEAWLDAAGALTARPTLKP